MTNRTYWLDARFSRFDSLWMIAAGWCIGTDRFFLAICLIVAGALLSSVLDYCLTGPGQ